MNPTFRYELVTDGAAGQHITQEFRNVPGVAETFTRISHGILRADFLRYLLIYANGGIYTDIDTECSRPITTWVAEDYLAHANLVLGVEYDSLGDPRHDRFAGADLSLCQWTFMAIPRHPVLWHVIDTVRHTLNGRFPAGSDIAAEAEDDVGELTGPAVLYWF